MKLLAIAALLAMSAGCVTHRRAVVDTRNQIEGVGGTIAGIVRGSGNVEPLSGRLVTVVNEATGQTYQVSTASNGGYTVKVPAGKYRLDVELRAGEAFEARPDPTDVNVGDLDPGRDFVLTVRRE
jgi:hypothetical protein